MFFPWSLESWLSGVEFCTFVHSHRIFTYSENLCFFSAGVIDAVIVDDVMWRAVFALLKINGLIEIRQICRRMLFELAAGNVEIREDGFYRRPKAWAVIHFF